MTRGGGANSLLVIGAGGHARVVIDVARAAGFEPVAALDKGNPGSRCNGVEVIGGDDKAQSLFADGIRQAVIAIGDNRLRLELGERLAAYGFTLPAMIHPTAVVSPSARIGDGTVIMPLAIINAAAVVGCLAILNSSSVIEHDCVIGDGAHVAPGSRLGGNVSIGTGSLVGIGSVVRPQACVGKFAIVGAGATVIENIGDEEIATGSPARTRRPS